MRTWERAYGENGTISHNGPSWIDKNSSVIKGSDSTIDFSVLCGIKCRAWNEKSQVCYNHFKCPPAAKNYAIPMILITVVVILLCHSEDELATRPIYRNRVRQKARKCLEVGATHSLLEGCQRGKWMWCPVRHKESSMSLLNWEAMYSRFWQKNPYFPTFNS